jgi:hypothetical protein
MIGRYLAPQVLPLIHGDSVVAKTERLSDTIAVDKPLTTRPNAVDEHPRDRGQPAAERG